MPKSRLLYTRFFWSDSKDFAFSNHLLQLCLSSTTKGKIWFSQVSLPRWQQLLVIKLNCCIEQNIFRMCYSVLAWSGRTKQSFQVELIATKRSKNSQDVIKSEWHSENNFLATEATMANTLENHSTLHWHCSLSNYQTLEYQCLHCCLGGRDNSRLVGLLLFAWTFKPPANKPVPLLFW